MKPRTPRRSLSNLLPRSAAFALATWISLLVIGCADSEKSNRSKELELRERELKLREDELPRKRPSEKTSSPETPEKTDAPPRDAGAPVATPTSTPAPTPPPAPNRVADVTIVVTIDQTKEDGRKWDVGNGAPDPLLSVRKTGGQTWNNSSTDSFGISHSMSAIAFESGDALTISAIDKDLSEHDPIGTVSVPWGGRSQTVTRRAGPMEVTVTFSNARP